MQSRSNNSESRKIEEPNKLDMENKYQFVLLQNIEAVPRPEYNKIYVSLENGQIKYLVIDPANIPQVDYIDIHMLGKRIPANVTQLQPLFEDILYIISIRGHIQSSLPLLINKSLEKCKPAYGHAMYLVVGNTGAGKSTTINYLSRYLMIENEDNAAAEPADPSVPMPCYAGDSASSITLAPKAIMLQEGLLN